MSAHKAVAVSLALLGAAFLASAALAEGTGLIAATPAELKWTPAPSVGPGVMISVIEGDLKKPEPFTMRLMLPANTKVGVHTHPVTERVTVISGTFYFATGDTFDAVINLAAICNPGVYITNPLDVIRANFTDVSGLVSVGTLAGTSGRFDLPEGLDLDQFSVVDVSEEQFDGDPAHSGDSIVRGPLQA